MIHKYTREKATRDFTRLETAYALLARFPASGEADSSWYCHGEDTPAHRDLVAWGLISVEEVSAYTYVERLTEKGARVLAGLPTLPNTGV